MINRETNKHKERIKHYTPINSSSFADSFFEGQVDLIKEIIEDILEIDISVVTKMEVQSVTGVPGLKKSVFDILVIFETKESKMVTADIEFQNVDQNDILERSLEYKSAAICRSLQRGDKAKKLVKIILIFFVNFDASKRNIPFFRLETSLKDMIKKKNYHFNSYEDTFWKEPERYFINVQELSEESYRDLAVGRWSHDLLEIDPDKVINERYKERLSYLKKTEKGEKEMLDLDKEAFDDGYTQAEAQIAERFIEDSLNEGVALDKIIAKAKMYFIKIDIESIVSKYISVN